MKRLKEILISIGIIIILLIVFRSFLYRTFVSYSEVGVRTNITLIDTALTKEIAQKYGEKILTIDEIMRISADFTSEKLSFTFNTASNNPNKCVSLKKANCIGYSSLYNAIGNYLIAKQDMTDEFEFRHLIGKISVFGFDIHALFNSPFFKDHDFNEIKDKRTGEKVYVDPSMRDYLRIENVTCK